MQNGKPYILFCAGEDSGDCIGEGLVTQAFAACNRLQKSYEFRGAGGIRMQQAGLLPLVDFEELPVSGFGDVLPKYWKLRKAYKILEKALKSEQCAGLVAIDYPGFNMKLVALAKKLNKPVLYVAPPQIWAWKSHRAKLFANCGWISLAVFFDFEVEAYLAANCNVVKTQHPFAEMILREEGQARDCTPEVLRKQGPVLLLPGSRKGQALRNIPVFLRTLQDSALKEILIGKEIILLAARESLVPVFEKAVSGMGVSVMVSSKSAEERARLFRSASVALSAPGTSTLELALSDCPTVVCTKPDALTLLLAKRSVKTSFFALPNLILQEEVFPEFILERASSVQDAIKEMTTKTPSFSKKILQRLESKGDSENLMSEFFAQFL